MSTTPSTIEQLQTLADRCPFNHWLGLRITAVGSGSVEVSVPWRPEIIGIPDPPTTHGGVLAAILDFTASNAIATRLGQAVPTIDLRIDYLRVAKPGALTAKGRVLRLGRTLGSAESEVYDSQGNLVATGRGSFFAAKIAARGVFDGRLKKSEGICPCPLSDGRSQARTPERKSDHG